MKDWNEIYKEKGVVQEGIREGIANVVNFFKENNIKTVLDLGCGTGRHTELMVKDNLDVTGCDISEEAIQITKEKFPDIKLDICDMDSLPYENDSFDAILCTDVLQHGKLEKIKKTISEIHRVLRKEGLLFLTVCSPKHPKYATGEELEPNTRINIEGLDGHVPHHFFEEDEMKQLFSQFEIITLKEVIEENPIAPGKMSANWQMFAKKK